MYPLTDEMCDLHRTTTELCLQYIPDTSLASVMLLVLYSYLTTEKTEAIAETWSLDCAPSFYIVSMLCLISDEISFEGPSSI